MQVFKSGLPSPLDSKPVVTIGSFDGLHTGHRKIINALKARAQALRTVSGIITFSPLPIIYFSPNFTYLITSEQEREDLIQSAGLDFIYYFRFDKQFAALPPQAFLERVKAVLNPQGIVVGQNHRFGRNQLGDIALLKKLGRKLDIPVQIIRPMATGGARVSSTRIRESLLLGNVALANRMLGYQYTIQGTVVRGHGRGRHLGIPTINIKIYYDKSVDGTHKLVPLDGVYITRVAVGQEVFRGVMSIGRRPTFQDSPTGDERWMEVHLLDFNQDLYGATVKIFFLKRLRPIRRFRDEKSLVEVIRGDIAKARHYFRVRRHISP